MSVLERLAEERIRQAREQGLWAQPSPYRGRRVPLPPENPFLPRAWWAAFHILETHDLLPPWLQRQVWIRRAREAWRRDLRRVLRTWPPGDPRRAVALTHLREQARTLNVHIRDANLVRPWGSAPIPPLDWDAERAAADVPEEAP